MPPPRYMPEDWVAIMRPALHTWARTAAARYGVADGRTIWKHQARAPAPAKPYVAIGTLAPPTPEGQSWELGPRAVRIAVVANSTLYRVTIDADDFDFTSDADATVEEIRTGLIAAIGAAASPSPHFPEVLLLSDELVPADAFLAVSAELELHLVQYKVGESNFTLSVDVYVDPADGQAESSAVLVAAGMMRSLEDEPHLEALRTAGLAVVGVTGSRRFPSARDGGWEDRAGFDVQLRALGRSASLITWIEDAGPLEGSFSA